MFISKHPLFLCITRGEARGIFVTGHNTTNTCGLSPFHSPPNEIVPLDTEYLLSNPRDVGVAGSSLPPPVR